MKSLRKLQTYSLIIVGVLVLSLITGLTLHGISPISPAKVHKEVFTVEPEEIPTPAIPFRGGTALSKEKPSSELDIIGRMIIYTARLKLKVDFVDEAVADIRYIAESIGGFVSELSISGEGEEKIGIITIRIPQKDFYVVISEIERLGDIESKNIRGEDVTERYIDLKARLSNLEKQEQRLLEILAMCRTVDEVLKVESELNRIRGQIEQLKGQIQYLERRVEFASITVSLRQVVEPWLRIPSFDWRLPIETGLRLLFLITQGLITLTIMAAPFAAIGAPVYRIYKSKKRAEPT